MSADSEDMSFEVGFAQMPSTTSRTGLGVKVGGRDGGHEGSDVPLKNGANIVSEVGLKE